MNHFLILILLCLSLVARGAPVSVTAYIGDSRSLAIPLTWDDAAFSPGADYTLLFTVKATANAEDAAALIQKTTGAGISAIASTATVELVPADSVALAPATLPFDIQAQHNTTGAVRTVAVGRITFSRDVTRLTTASIPIYTTQPPTGGGGGGTWGSITGTLSAQADLQAAMDAKLGITAAASTYATSAALTAGLSGKQPIGSYPNGSGVSTGTNTGDQTNIAGNAATATLAANSTLSGGQAVGPTASPTFAGVSNGAGELALGSSDLGTHYLRASGSSIAINPGTSAILAIGSTGRIGFVSTSTNAFVDPDACFQSSGAGVIEINSGTAGQFRDLSVRNITASGSIASSGNGYNGILTDPAGQNAGFGWTSNGPGFLRYGSIFASFVNGASVGGGSGLNLGSGLIGWDGGTGIAAFDVALGRNAAGVAEINNGTAGGTGHLKTNAAYLEGSEMTAPADPAANGYRIFAEDNGSGKTRLMVKFATGSAVQIAIEP